MALIQATCIAAACPPLMLPLLPPAARSPFTLPLLPLQGPMVHIGACVASVITYMDFSECRLLAYLHDVAL